ncbi:MAG: hypothetical protein JJU33_12950 [Phycisphaerales bacterium]|nr:hypothetical protein [Phycisphaerales bacterium]
MDSAAQLIIGLLFTVAYIVAGAVSLRRSARWVTGEEYPFRLAFHASWVAIALTMLMMLPVIGVLASLGPKPGDWLVLLSILGVVTTAQAAANKQFFETGLFSSVVIAAIPLLLFFVVGVLVVVTTSALFGFQII